MEWYYWIILVVVAWISISLYSRSQRRKSLLARYQDEKIVDMIMDGTVWQGQTEEQLLDTLGKPAAMDENVLKTKTKVTWKYHREGQNRYGLRVIVENGLVVGWKQKG